MCGEKTLIKKIDSLLQCRRIWPYEYRVELERVVVKSIIAVCGLAAIDCPARVDEAQLLLLSRKINKRAPELIDAVTLCLQITRKIAQISDRSNQADDGCVRIKFHTEIDLGLLKEFFQDIVKEVPVPSHLN
ncbi:hypothetical protein EOM81_11715 [bacterium]|nr:hypothetical protein [bacterium]